jgi:hypothetical protein
MGKKVSWFGNDHDEIDEIMFRKEKEEGRETPPYFLSRRQDMKTQTTPVAGVITALQSHRYRERIGLDWPISHPRNSDLRPQKR